MSTFSKVADLPITIESYDLEPHELEVSSEFTRLTTVIRIKGAGEGGVGEDVTYDALDHVAQQDAGPILPLAGSYSVAELCEKLGELDLFPAEPVREVSRLYRRWAFESAALDLALRQAGRSLADVLGLEPRPVTFVMSMRLARPPTIEPVRKRLEKYATLRFKLDPTSDWTDELIAELVETGAVDSVDFKGFYKDTPVDQPADPVLYRRVIEALPDAWIEDPAITDETLPILEPHHDRITYDAPIHSIEDIESLRWPPKMVNVKPSRFGSLQSLMATYDYLDDRGIHAYGGGQWELSCGRGQIQYLASLFHPDTPNDVAPIGYGNPNVPDGLPASPLAPAASETGFRWDSSS
jgi:L-alanine-DL-glutamate epimerase-like enolase superfamily enzyme